MTDLRPYYGYRAPRMEAKPNPFELVDVAPREIVRARKSPRRGHFFREQRRQIRCEACGWAPSQATKARIKSWRALLHAHHIVPLSCRGGRDVSENVALLCPTCHAIEHRLNPIERTEPGDNDWPGPTTRSALIAELVAVRTDENATTSATTGPSSLETT